MHTTSTPRDNPESDQLLNEQATYDHDTVDVEPTKQKDHHRRLLFRLGVSFFLFGLCNNVLYVIILSAALDLVPPSTPKGIIAFCNIAPALVAKIGWSYVLKGRIRYGRRVMGCCILSISGMAVVALFESLSMRLLGIAFASFSSGLGEISFLQLSTTYAPPAIGGHSVGYFASGTGAAGLVGAFLWWELRKLGVKMGVGLSSVLPLAMPLTYFLLLPQNTAFLSSSSSTLANYEEQTNPSQVIPYTPLATTEDGDEGEEEMLPPKPEEKVALSLDDKLRLVKPLLSKYMLPLFSVYVLEYTINQGISPTLLYPVPSPEEHWFLSKIIHSIRDYYPFWQLVYQSTVFLSRSSISLGLPAFPTRLLFIPALTQAIILFLLVLESAFGLFPPEYEGLNIFFVFVLISIEGICGGLAYVNVFYRLNQEHPDPHSTHGLERRKQEREFKIGSIGFSDSTGILLASILAVPTEVELCKVQMRRGKFLCQGL